MRHCIIFCNRKRAKGRKPRKKGQEPGLQGREVGGLDPPVPPHFSTFLCKSKNFLHSNEVK